MTLNCIQIGWIPGQVCRGIVGNQPTVSLGQKIMSSYDKIFKVLNEWYTPDQIEKIWDLLKEFDKTLKLSSPQAGGPAHKESGFKR